MTRDFFSDYEKSQYTPKREIVGSYGKALEHLRLMIGESRVEKFVVLFLDRKNGLIAGEVMAIGSIDHVSVYPREIARRVLELDASAVIISHNHPSGDPTPSRQDITMTKSIRDALDLFSVTIHDHIIIGDNCYHSMRANSEI